jgi:hypothetical protein
MAKGGFYSRLASDEITTHGYRVLTFAMCTTIIIGEFAVTSGLGSSFHYMVWMGMGWYWSSLCGSFVITLCPFVIILCDILKFNLIG